MFVNLSFQSSDDLPKHQRQDSTDNEEYSGRENIKASSPPLSSEDDSDVESLHSFHYSPKAVDIPSAIRLAKRLYGLDGFKKSDVSRHLSKKYVTAVGCYVYCLTYMFFFQ